MVNSPGASPFWACGGTLTAPSWGSSWMSCPCWSDCCAASTSLPMKLWLTGSGKGASPSRDGVGKQPHMRPLHCQLEPARDSADWLWVQPLLYSNCCHAVGQRVMHEARSERQAGPENGPAHAMLSACSCSKAVGTVLPLDCSGMATC